MVSPVRKFATDSRSDRLLITKIITTIALAVLLVIGAGSSGNHEAESSPAVSHTTVATTFTADVDDVALSAAAASPSSADEANVFLCILAIISALLLVITARLGILRFALPSPAPSGRRATPLVAHGAPVSALSLTQLSISRT